MLENLREEFRRARVERGLSQRTVAAAAGFSQPEISRFERGLRDQMSIPLLTRLLSCVGLVLSARAYPDGQPIRDVAHRALLERLQAMLPPSARIRFEVPLPIPGDLRAWDATIQFAKTLIGIEAETAPRDMQALQRRVALKLRDDPRVQHVLVVFADTRRNRRLLREYGEALRAEWRVPATEILEALRDGRDPAGSGVLVL